MANVVDNLAKLTNYEIRTELMKFGIKPGPLTPTTRRVYLKKLARKYCSSVPCALEPPTNAENNETWKRKEVLLPSTNLISSELQCKQQPNVVESGESSISPQQNKDGNYYVVQCSSGDAAVLSLIFDNKACAWNAFRKHKDGRFHQFTSLSEAEAFSKGNKQLTESNGVSNATTEKANDFPTPKQVDLNRLMQAIECSDIVLFDKLVWENPRYLISSADGPVPLKPNTRYNALHVAAKSNQAEMVQKTIATLEDVKFFQLMYNTVNMNDMEKFSTRKNHIVDLYLNTPEKINFESPLHLACKLGYTEVVAELVSHPLCCKTSKNKFGQTPVDIICSRAKEPKAKEEIFSLLQDQYYVPLLRSQDSSVPPSVGEPWTLAEREMDCSKEAVASVPIKPELFISAIAGPMSQQYAQELQRCWATPSKRDLRGRRLIDIRCSDFEKGDERIGRELTKQEGIDWLEYWNFLDAFANFSTPEGLAMLERYLQRKAAEKEDAQRSLFISSSDDSMADLCSQMERVKVEDISVMSENEFNSRGDNTAENMKMDKNWIRLNIDKKTASDQDIAVSVHGSLSRIRHRQLRRIFGSLENQTKIPKRLHFDDLVLHGPLPSLGSELPLSTHPDGSCSLTRVKTTDVEAFPSTRYSTPKARFANCCREDFSEDQLASGDSLSCSTFCDTNESLTYTFIVGDSPTKVDRDVLLAISNAEIDKSAYPHIHRWMKKVLSYNEDDRKRWRTPRRVNSMESHSPARQSTSTNSKQFACPVLDKPHRSLFKPTSLKSVTSP